MPTVSVFQDCLQAALGADLTEKTFFELCFDFGLELDDVTCEYDIVAKEKGEAAAKGLSKRVIFKVDVPANRYDLLCIEGLVRALKIFKGHMTAPTYTVQPSKPVPKMQMTVRAATAQIRPFVVAAVLRGVTFDQDSYQSFIDLQDKLHMNICRRRTLVAIGTHDLSTLVPPFTYEALPPKDIKFRPLSNPDEEMDGNRLMEALATHQQLKNYIGIIKDSPVFPVIYDSKRTVLSVPPIINGDHSKIRLETKDVFIECTATDLTKANITLNTVVTMFAEYCKVPFVAEPVEVIYDTDYPANTFVKPGDRIIYPKLETRPMKADINRMKRALSLEKSTSDELTALLAKMSIPNSVDKKDSNVLNVEVPVTRSDIMHECDLIEDIGIAYGYNNLRTEVPQTFGGSRKQPVNHLGDLLRQEVAMAGYTECMNWALISIKENFTQMRREEMPEKEWLKLAVERPYEYNPSATAVSISNPKTVGFEIIRTSIIPGLLKTLTNSKHNSPPIKLFELGDVVLQDPTPETKCRNVRRLAVIHSAGKSQMHILHGILDQVMYCLGCEPEHDKKEGSTKRPWKLVASEDPAFFPGMQAHIVCNEINIGVIGELHPEVLTSQGFDVNLPTSAFELNLEPFLEWL